MLTKNQKLQILKFAKKEMDRKKDLFHDWSHALRVSKIASYLAKEEKANIEICQIAGLLHDIAPKTRGIPHGPVSAKMAKKFLNKIGVNKKFTESIFLAICFHDTKLSHNINTPEGQIIFESDKLECSGPVGFIREFGDLLQLKNPHAIEESLNYLLHYNPVFKTKKGNELKNRLSKFNQQFVMLYHEWD